MLDQTCYCAAVCSSSHAQLDTQVPAGGAPCSQSLLRASLQGCATCEGFSPAASGSSLLLARLTLARPSVSSTTITFPTLPCCRALAATRMVCAPQHASAVLKSAGYECRLVVALDMTPGERCVLQSRIRPVTWHVLCSPQQAKWCTVAHASGVSRLPEHHCSKGASFLGLETPAAPSAPGFRCPLSALHGRGQL